MEVKGQVAIVTGAASGLGEASARRLAGEGARLGLVDLNAERLEALAGEIGGLALPADVSQGKSLKDAFARLAAWAGTPRIAVACAGIAPGELIVDREGRPGGLETFARTLAVNLTGTYNLLRLAAAGMAKLDALEDGERGVIVTTTSIAAFEGQVGQAAYAASKGGVAALTLPAARELARIGVRVLCIAPGLFETPMLRSLPPKVQEGLVATTLFPKRLGQPDEYARLVLHMIGNVALNGETVRLDGAVRLAAK